MLVAAGMDAQQLEDKLVGDVKAGREALLAEVDPVNKAELRIMWKEAKDELNSFRRQQVAGGEDSNQGCRGRPAWHAAAGGVPWEALSRALPAGLAEALELGRAGDIWTCSVHPTRAAPWPQGLSRALQLEHTMHEPCARSKWHNPHVWMGDADLLPV